MMSETLVYCGRDHCTGLWNLRCDAKEHPRTLLTDKHAFVESAFCHGCDRHIQDEIHIVSPMTNQPVQQQGVCLVDHGGRECTCPGFNGNPPTGSSQPVQPAWEEMFARYCRTYMLRHGIPDDWNLIGATGNLTVAVRVILSQLLDGVGLGESPFHVGDYTTIGSPVNQALVECWRAANAALNQNLASLRTKYELDK